jgi:hypothetical protein
MVSYKCIYCQQSFYHKGNYSFHNKNIEKCKEKFENNIKKFKTYTNIKLIDDYKNLLIITLENQCEYCKKKFTSTNGLKKHNLKNNCSTTQLDICDKLTQKNKSNNVVSNKITTTNSNNISNNQVNSNNNTQNNITNNINNNIKLVPYDEIKYDYMKEEVLRKAFEIPGEAFQSITTDTFFDPDNKENHVIYCPNLNNGQIHVFNGNKFSADGWDIVDKKEFFKEMLTRQINTLEKIRRYNELDDNPLEINNIVGFANLFKEFNANHNVIKEYTGKLNTLCYKNNPIVKKTKEESKDNKIRNMIKRALAN